MDANRATPVMPGERTLLTAQATSLRTEENPILLDLSVVTSPIATGSIGD